MSEVVWAQRFRQSSKSFSPSFEDLCQCYAFLRSTRSILERVPKACRDVQWKSFHDRLEFLFSESGFGSTLDTVEIIHSLDEIGCGPDSTYAARKAYWLGSERAKVRRPWERVSQEYMERGSSINRSMAWQWRCEEAARAALADGWYIMFGTYTVDPKITDSMGLASRDDLWKKTPAWDRFVKRFKTETADACGYGRKPAKWPPGYTFFQYFAVVEHGASREHPHVHALWFCKEIPEHWKTDPNEGLPESLRFETDIRPASALWPYGREKRTIGLLVGGSWFAENWDPPIDERTGKLYRIGTVAAVAAYVGKYMTKGETKQWNHRVKATKSLGLGRLISALERTESKAMLMLLSKRPAEYKVALQLQSMTAVPLALVREKSKRELQRRLHFSRTPQARGLLRKIWAKKKSTFYFDFMNSVKDGQPPWKLSKEQRYNLFTLMLEGVDSTVHCERRVEELLNWYKLHFGDKVYAEPYALVKGEFGVL